MFARGGGAGPTRPGLREPQPQQQQRPCGPPRHRRGRTELCRPACAEASLSPAPATAATPARAPLPSVFVSLDNSADPNATLIRLRASDQEGLLARLVSALQELGISVQEARITTNASRQAEDTFLVTSSETGQKLEDDTLDGVSEHLRRSLRRGPGVKSGQPLIYGEAAALDVAALKARQAARAAGGAAEGAAAAGTDAKAVAAALRDAEALELAAAELAVAASALVSAERAALAAAAAAVAATDKPGLEAGAERLDEAEAARADCALALERRISALEAAVASRRSPKASVADRLREERLRELVEGGRPAAPADVGAVSGPGLGSGGEVVLQAFGWDSHAARNPGWYGRLAAAAPAIAAAGYTAVWLGYLPRDLYLLNSAYGSEEELRGTLRAFRDEGVKCVADVVVNHRCAQYQKHGLWNQFGGRLAWDESAVCSGGAFGGTGRPNTGEPYGAAPNIDHTNPKVRAGITEWLQYLRGVGFDGWRFDYVKGYGAEFTRGYVDASVPVLAFGEYWDACSYTGGVLDYNQDAHRQRTINWIDRTGGTTGAFDFTTKACLQEAVSRSEYWRLVDAKGRMPGVAGLWAMRAVTFIENHDTGPPLAHWPFPANELAQGYAYILTHPGTPCVLWSHWDAATAAPGLAATVTQLLALRRALRVTAKSTVVVLRASADCYAACVDGRLAVKIGPGAWSPNKERLEGVHWTRAVEARNCCVWTRDKAGAAAAR